MQILSLSAFCILSLHILIYGFILCIQKWEIPFLTLTALSTLYSLSVPYVRFTVRQQFSFISPPSSFTFYSKKRQG